MVRGKLCTTKGSSQFAENFQKGHKQTSRAMPLICVRLKPEEACKGLFVLRLLLPSSSVFETFFLLSALKIPFCQQPPVETSVAQATEAPTEPAGETSEIVHFSFLTFHFHIVERQPEHTE